MKQLVISIILACIIPRICWAGCDWSTDVTPGTNHTWIYSDECHLEVGKLVQSNKVQLQQINDLTNAVQLKNLALTADDSRVMLWQKSADDELSRLNTIQADQHRSDFLYFTLGVAAAIGTGWMASRLIHP
jgi:hypothetical protein